MLQIYNSLTREKSSFKPRLGKKVGMYVCGMTVYDYCHIGHARVLVVFDIVARYLRHLGYDVTYVRNITDIDDKIIQRAHDINDEDNIDAKVTKLTDRFIKAMHDDAGMLGVLPPDIEPRATTSMTEIIAMISTLVDNGHAYAAANGDVYYDVSRFGGYGKLSGKKLEDLRAGERVAVDEAKDDPLDFVLWKAAKPGDPSWNSPWGKGRPGWHIECSAMATHCLGDSFDIHGGGMDLMFPHHENEIAQSEAATGQPFATTWMHNGFVNIDNEKMSKSLGNFFTVREVLKKYHGNGELIRYFILTSHYRSPLNYSVETLDNAKLELEAFYTALRNTTAADVDCGEYETKFMAAMDDDFNTSLALTILKDVRSQLNKSKDAPGAGDRVEYYAGVLVKLGGIMGLFQQNPDDYLKHRYLIAETGHIRVTGYNANLTLGYTDEKIEELIAERANARLAKDWAEADRIRDELDAHGVVLEDVAGKTTWRRK